MTILNRIDCHFCFTQLSEDFVTFVYYKMLDVAKFERLISD